MDSLLCFPLLLNIRYTFFVQGFILCICIFQTYSICSPLVCANQYIYFDIVVSWVSPRKLNNLQMWKGQNYCKTSRRKTTTFDCKSLGSAHKAVCANVPYKQLCIKMINFHALKWRNIFQKFCTIWSTLHCNVGKPSLQLRITDFVRISVCPTLAMPILEKQNNCAAAALFPGYVISRFNRILISDFCL